MPQSPILPHKAFGVDSARSYALPADAAPTVSESIARLSGDPNFMTTLARGLAVIQAFSQRKRQVTVSQLSAKTGLSRAAVRRCLYTLQKLGFAGSSDSRHFFLLPRILTLGCSCISSIPLGAVLQPVIERLSHQLHESCSLATLDGANVIYIAHAPFTRMMSTDLGVGSRLPAFCTSTGRVLLAHLPENELESLLAGVHLQRTTDRTIVTAEKLRPALQLARQNGYCIVDQEFELGFRSIAVPVRNAFGKVLAALNVGAPAQRVTVQHMQAEFLPALRAAAAELDRLFS